jgi:hypothetical protein
MSTDRNEPAGRQSARMRAMRAHPFGAFVILGLLAGCGGQSPSAPAAIPSVPGTSSTLGIVAAAVNQATAKMAMTVSPDGLSRATTVPCADGGSTSVTVTSAGTVTSPTFSSSSRIEFTDCRSQSVTINGDPAIVMDGTYTFERTTGGTVSSVTATTRMTGGLRFDAPGTSGRARYDCTLTISMQINADGTPGPPTIGGSGTITWEQPIGRVSVQSCGA